MRRWRLDVAYDGSGFSGWASQRELRTVQGTLEHWIGRVLRLSAAPTVVCAGRTDAGVHARGQVAHVDLPADLVDDAGVVLFRRLARVLPDDVVVRAVNPAAANFDARFAAIWRRYVYRLSDGEAGPDPLYRHQIAQVRHRLDVAAMNEAAVHLLGLRDFAAFCRRRPGATTIRTLLELAGTRLDAGPMAGVIELTVKADAFCHSMVRSLVGALDAVGTGRRDADWLQRVASGAVRDSGVPVMPAHGLTLEEVGYPADDRLASRVRQARSVRELPR
ncbi:tRNA pseudouridine(38-40) synthase TruA [Microlunatus panaciterrae]|uniref:tRNA pseudouridine(38-40) synthase TruA n=1 Tax=Microlunatus panaciterrae TaxID=400768 RepID=UPI00195E7CCC|nr:tRNA pseudouridine(38-40) synthase TruA [Microlunatus panaciterrae]